MRVELTPAAKAELAEARDWYDDQHPYLGERFMSEFRALAVRLSEHPRLFPTVRGEARRAVFHRFPYGLFFRIQGDVVEVFACFHARRHPRRWQRRM
jgi:plasmid stabilization system protein ParE